MSASIVGLSSKVVLPPGAAWYRQLQRPTGPVGCQQCSIECHSYRHFWSLVQVLSKCFQCPWLHDLKMPDTCMLVYFFGDISLIWPFLMAPMIPPECRPRFRFWRRSAVVACSVASAVCNYRSCADVILQAFVISSAYNVAPPLSLPLMYNVDPWMML